MLIMLAMVVGRGGDDSRGQGEIIIAKHRNGALENVRLKFTAEFAKFSDLDYYDNLESNITDESMISTASSSMNEDNSDNAPF